MAEEMLAQAVKLVSVNVKNMLIVLVIFGTFSLLEFVTL